MVCLDSLYRMNPYQTFLRFKTVFENSHVSVQICDAEGKTVLVNNAWKELWGLDEEFIENFIMKEYNILEDPILKEKGCIPYIEKAYAGEVSEVPELLYDPANFGLPGIARFVEGVVYPLKDAWGSVKEIIIIHKDITEQKIALEKHNFIASVASILMETLDYHKTLEQLAMGTIPFLADGCIIEMLEEGEIKRIVSYHHDPLLHSELKELRMKFPTFLSSNTPTARVIRSGIPEIRSPFSFEEMGELLNNDDHVQLLKNIKLKSHMALPIKIRGETVGAMNFGITGNRRSFSEEDLDVAMEVARHAALAIDNARLYEKAQKALKQREDLISMASHEMKTPLTTLKLQMEVLMLSARSDQHESFLTNLERIASTTQRQMNRLENVIDNLLDLTRMGQGRLSREFKKNELGELVQEVVERFHEQLTHFNISLNSEVATDCWVVCDLFRIDQVITNLISNAIRYGERKPMHLKLMKVDGKVIFEMHDQGMGIAPENHQRIFQQFERVLGATDGQGLGLGLYIAREIIVEHSGLMKVESSLGRGSVFSFELPAFSDDSTGHNF
jgi:PAS domain S-box-containing protein